MQHVAIAGLTFGDEAKGGTTAKYVEQELELSHKPVVVRYNGGPQGSHAVTVGSIKLISQMYGAGTLLNVPTYISQYVVIDPIQIWLETQELDTLNIAYGKLYVHKDALVATPFQAAAAVAAAKEKGESTCGYGVSVALRDALAYPDESITAADLVNPTALFNKLKLQHTRYQSFLLHDVFCKTVMATYADLVSTFLQDYIRVGTLLNSYGGLIDRDKANEWLHTFDVAVYEGTQGVLLDPVEGFAPDTVSTSCTFENVYRIVPEDEHRNIFKVGCVRSYMIRHGNGKFPDAHPTHPIEVDKDIDNVDNDLQGAFRVTWLDQALLDKSLSVLNGVHAFSVSHVDLSLISNADFHIAMTRNALDGDYTLVKYKSLSAFINYLEGYAPVNLLGFGESLSERYWHFAEY